MNTCECRKKFEAMILDQPNALDGEVMRRGNEYISSLVNDWWRVWQTAWRLGEEAEEDKISYLTAQLQRVVDCPLGNAGIKDYRALAAARGLIAESALERLLIPKRNSL